MGTFHLYYILGSIRLCSDLDQLKDATSYNSEDVFVSLNINSIKGNIYAGTVLVPFTVSGEVYAVQTVQVSSVDLSQVFSLTYILQGSDKTIRVGGISGISQTLDMYVRIFYK